MNNELNEIANEIIKSHDEAQLQHADEALIDAVGLKVLLSSNKEFSVFQSRKNLFLSLSPDKKIAFINSIW